jgi:hypothetical protein
MQKRIPIAVTGRCIISDDLGNIILDKTNAIHPINLSRIFSRALSKEKNSFIHKIAIGNGGTFVDPANNIKYKSPNISNYKTKLYNETYLQILDGTNNSTLVSKELASYSQTVVTIYLDKNQPSNEYLSQSYSIPADSSYTFDEIALFSSGVSDDSPTSGYQSVVFNTPNITIDTGLLKDTNYVFSIFVDGTKFDYTLNMPSTDLSTLSFAKLVTYINDIPGLKNYMTVSMSQGYLKFTSKTSSSQSSIEVVDSSDNALWLFKNITTYQKIDTAVNGKDSGLQNNPNNPDAEYSRMLTHLIFNPITKPYDRIYTVDYILNINVVQA